MAGNRERRLALNEAAFREANERAKDWEGRHEGGAPDIFFCECAHDDCREKLSLTRADYERVRRDPTHFIVSPGHEILDIERVIETREGWSVIEKNEDVHDLVRSTDPRS